MPKPPRWTAAEAQHTVLAAGFGHLGSKGSHHIYGKGSLRVTVPFHGGAVVHPKIIKQVLETIEDARRSTATER